MEWLIFGRGPAKGDPGGDSADHVFEGRIFGDLLPRLAESLDRGIHWSSGDVRLRLGLLRLMRDVHATAPTDEDQRRALGRVARFLDNAVPHADELFAGLEELSGRECRQVLMHIEGLLYLLFRPFREETISFARSVAMRRPMAPDDERDEAPTDLRALAKKVLVEVGADADGDRLLHTAEELWPHLAQTELLAVVNATIQLRNEGRASGGDSAGDDSTQPVDEGP